LTVFVLRLSNSASRLVTTPRIFGFALGRKCSPADVLARIATLPWGGFANCCHGIGAPMSGLSRRRLKQLDEELLALGEETMLLEELDGFIAGLLVCPDLIKPGEWLPIIWNRGRADQQPALRQP
jgi:uncharacterized protein